MGCFSFLCKNSEEPALSTSFDGSPCYLFLLEDGKVIEEMYGNYDSYGRVFNGNMESFKWEKEWNEVCNLMFDSDDSNGIAMILEEHFDGEIPKTRSDSDPNQGWGEEYDLLGSVKNQLFNKVEKPYHKTYYNESNI